jgi:2-polyprenyl-3-methyl-5-hydroxy-6-metoxy-1,4-benzoquinol methylase
VSVEFWDDRFASDAYAYGTEPSRFLAEHLRSLPPGKILFPAEGEGRNAVYAAEQGWDVVAFDQSKEGSRKALALAEQKQVQLNYVVAPWENFEYPEASFDAAVLVFVHVPAEQRTAFHRRIVQFLKPGGTVILEGFSKDQITFSSGGPKDTALLFSAEEILNDFTDMDVHILKLEQVMLNEGPYHTGEASVIRYIGKRR